MNTNIVRHMGPFAGPSKTELCDEIDDLREQRSALIRQLESTERRLKDAVAYNHRLVDEHASREAKRVLDFFDCVQGHATSAIRVDDIVTRDFAHKCLMFSYAIPYNIRTMDSAVPMPSTQVALLMRQAADEIAQELYKEFEEFMYTKVIPTERS